MFNPALALIAVYLVCLFAFVFRLIAANHREVDFFARSISLYGTYAVVPTAVLVSWAEVRGGEALLMFITCYTHICAVFGGAYIWRGLVRIFKLVTAWLPSGR